MVKRSTKTPHKPEVKRIIIQGIEHAHYACKIANNINPKTNLVIELWSDKNGAASLGPAWFKGIIDIVKKDFPELKIIGVLDCGEAAGHALAALRQGISCIHTSTRPSVVIKIKMIADKVHAEVRTRRPRMLNLIEQRDPCTSLQKFLS